MKYWWKQGKTEEKRQDSAKLAHPLVVCENFAHHLPCANLLLHHFSKIAKERLKKWHDQLVNQKNFAKGQRVLLYDSKLHLFPGKLKSRWTGPFIIHEVQPNGVVELLNFNSTRTFKVNGHRLKPYIESFSRDKEEFILLDPPPTWKHLVHGWT